MKNKILELSASGMNYTQIKEELGCSKGTISYYLGEGQKEKTLARQRDRRGIAVKYIQELKQNTPCADCKESYPYWIMEFDHLRDKLFTIGTFKKTTCDLKKVIAEIEKCEVVCSNCHKNRTYNRSRGNGSNAMDVSQFKDYIE